MRSLIRAVVAATLIASPAFAQARPATETKATTQTEPATSDFEVGRWYAGPRVWVGNLNGAVAIGGQVEKGFTKPGQYGPGIIGGGLGLDWYSWSYDYPLGLGSYKYSVIPFQVFSNYHFVIASNKKFDPYVGLAFVYSVVSASWSGGNDPGNADANYTNFAGQAGLRYFLKDNVALQGQIGFGYGTLGLGATWKF
jgi:hypothetical protein